MAEHARRPTLDPASGAIRNVVRAGLGAGSVPRIVVAVSGERIRWRSSTRAHSSTGAARSRPVP
ncbi:hypothetical protein IOD13_02195 [Brevibacterium casei]|nr:hypothetical protein [Brevibacterium casei]